MSLFGALLFVVNVVLMLLLFSLIRYGLGFLRGGKEREKEKNKPN